MGVSGVPDIRESGQIREWPAAAPGGTWRTRVLVPTLFLLKKGASAMPAGSRSAAQTAGGRKKDEIWDLVKNVEKVITKDGKATSEKRWVCKFCDRTLQGGPNIIMAHHGVHGSGKKKDVQRCRHTPPDVKARLEQEMSNTLRSVAQKETSSVIKSIRQEEEHVQRIEDAGIDTSVLVKTGQLKLAFQHASPTPQSTSASSASTVSAGESSGSSSTVNNELNTAADTVQSRKQSSNPKVSLIPTLTKKYSEVIARELDEAISAGCIAAGVPPSALQNPQLKAALELIARKVCQHMHTYSHSCYQTITRAFIMQPV